MLRPARNFSNAPILLKKSLRRRGCTGSGEAAEIRFRRGLLTEPICLAGVYSCFLTANLFQLISRRTSRSDFFNNIRQERK
jgi:hypothetical protein